MGATIYYPKEKEKHERTGAGSQVADRSDIQPAHELNGKAVIDIQNGEKIGQVDEILFDPDTLMVAALIITEGGLLNRQAKPLPASNIQVWGKDVLLVNRPEKAEPDRLPGQSKLPDQDRLVKLSEQLRGRYVVSTDGDRVGQIDDVLIDRRGRLAGYDLDQVFIEGPLVESKYIPVGATQSLGKDVLIVDLSRL